MIERQTDEGRQRQTAILTDNFSWPYNAVWTRSAKWGLEVIFKASLSTSASRSAGTQPETRCEPLPQRGAQSLKTLTVRISRGYLHISFHSTHAFAFNHVTASAYLNRCDLCRKSLIDGSVKDQYTTYRGKGTCAVGLYIFISKRR